MKKIIEYKDFSLQNILIDNEFRKKHNSLFLKKTATSSFILILVFILNEIRIKYSEIIFFITIIFYIAYAIYTSIDYNYKLNKILKKNYPLYSPKHLGYLKIYWDNPYLISCWIEKINERVKINRITKKTICDSIKYHKLAQYKEIKFTNLRAIISISSFLLASIASAFLLFPDNIQKQLQIRYTFFHISILGIIFIIQIVLIQLQKNEKESNNNHKKMQFLCEYLLENKNKSLSLHNLKKYNLK